MINLDNVELIKKTDPSDMLGLVENLPQQCEKAVENIKNFNAGPDYLKGKPSNIIITGLGGSAIGGDFIRTCFLNEIKIPIVVNRYYHLPKFVREKSLVIAVSYSGNTEETLSAYNEARERKAKIVCLTSGGKLEENCKSDNIPFLSIPSGFPPRASLGYQTLGLVGIFVKLGLVKDKSAEIKESIETLRSLRDEMKRDVPTEKNPAKKLATKLQGKIPVIYASQDLTDVVALRWKDQFNENSKAFAFNNVFPELNHNEIVGWEFPPALLKNFVVIMIRDKKENPQVKKRFEITGKLLKGLASEVVEVWTKGKSTMARLYSSILAGDFISVYLALLNGVDPTPVRRIEELKKQLIK